jgi:hypothetical protein
MEIWTEHSCELGKRTDTTDKYSDPCPAYMYGIMD